MRWLGLAFLLLVTPAFAAPPDFVGDDPQEAALWHAANVLRRACVATPAQCSGVDDVYARIQALHTTSAETLPLGTPPDLDHVGTDPAEQRLWYQNARAHRLWQNSCAVATSGECAKATAALNAVQDQIRTLHRSAMPNIGAQ